MSGHRDTDLARNPIAGALRALDLVPVKNEHLKRPFATIAGIFI